MNVHKHGHDHNEEFPRPRDTVHVEGRPGYFYRTGQVVAAAGDAQVEEWLGRAGGKVEARNDALGLDVWRLPDEPDAPSVPALIDSLRALDDPPAVAPNHVLFSAGHLHHWSETPPIPTGQPALSTDESMGGDVVVAVLDTGVIEHHHWLTPRIESGDPEQPGTPLGIDAGHGTFVAGVVAQVAPGVRLRVRKVISFDTLADDLSLAEAIVALARSGDELHLLNLSLGGYAHDDQGFPATWLALQQLAQVYPDLVVVSATGNDGWDRPVFPAAFKDVIGVAALDRIRSARATFSNHGWWVDACAQGEDVVSTFFEDWKGPLADPRVHDDLHFDGWATWSGTSFAAPVVTGAIAACMTRDQVGAREAAFRVVGASGLPTLSGLGTKVTPPPFG